MSRNDSPTKETTCQQQHLTAILTRLAGAAAPALAAGLLREFGSIRAVASANEADLQRFAGGAPPWIDAIVAGRSLFSLGLREVVTRSLLDPKDNIFRDYLVAKLRPLRHEILVAICADAHRGFLSEETIASGTIASVRTTPRAIFSKLLSLDARFFVLAHNHPSGSRKPSKDDLSNTRNIAHQAGQLGIELLDHFVISEHAVVSMADEGLL